MIAYNLSGFARKSAIPMIGIKPVTDFNFVPSIDLLVKETAITNQLIVSAKNDCELQRQTSLVPGEKLLQHALRLLVRLWANGKAHEIMICHEFGETVDVFFSKWTQN
jgi:hypothetical protein